MSTSSDNNIYLFPFRLREERERLKLTQTKLAKFCGVSREMWGRYENGRSMPGGEVLFALAAIGADVNFLMTGQRAHLISEDNPGYTLRPDLKALLDEVERCTPADQENIKRMAAMYAAANDDSTKR